MRYGRKGFDFGDFEITKREILASISIIAVMILFGILISSKISEHQMDKNEIYNKAVKIESQEMFQYGIDTNVGNAFVYGDLKAGSSCYDEDEFSLSSGLELAEMRLIVKYLDNQVKSIAKAM